MANQSVLSKSANKTKTQKDIERRDITNRRFKELQKEINLDGSNSSQISQEYILIKALAVATRIALESSGGPHYKGFFKGLEALENLVLSFIKSLIISEILKNRFKHDFHEAFEKYCAVEYGIPATSSRPSAPRKSARKLYKVKDEEERAKKNSLEQNRRDRLSACFDALQKFIFSNQLTKKPLNSTLEKLEILDIILEYIEENNALNMPFSGQDQAVYLKGLAKGQETAKEWALAFFKKDPRLVVHSANLEKYLEFNLNPKPLVGFPLAQQSQTISNSSNAMMIPPVQQPQPMMALQPTFGFPFPFLMMPHVPPSPIGSTGSPPATSSSDSSNESSPTLLNNNASSFNTDKSKIFRPWL